jgi:dTDP-4-dehydrorhamnose 3,5-epimerase
MIFAETGLPGAMVVEPECHVDERGMFARIWCAKEFAEHGLNSRLVQCSTSFNNRKGTLRGMHFQKAPHEEAKLVRCTRGAIYDVIVDLRPDSLTYLQHLAIELTQDNRKMLYIPEGCAHGFQTLADGSEVHYQISEYYSPESSAGFRWNDATFGINWPLGVSVISHRDRNYSDFSSAGQSR